MFAIPCTVVSCQRFSADKPTQQIREGVKNKNVKKYGLLPNRKGGGVSEGGKKPNCFFEKSIFQRVSRIILGPSKHVLHLVWSAYFISTAVRTALKVARTPQILGGKKAIIEAILKAKNTKNGIQ